MTYIRHGRQVIGALVSFLGLVPPVDEAKLPEGSGFSPCLMLYTGMALYPVSVCHTLGGVRGAKSPEISWE